MSPSLAALVFIAGIVGLFVLDRDPKSRPSSALWIPVFWMLINASRPVTVWLQRGTPSDSLESALDGSPLDAAAYALLLLAGTAVMVMRSQKAVNFLRANGPMLAFFGYCAISVLWSDYPLVALKRWIKAIGDVLMVMIVLTDPDRDVAVKRLLAWTGFLLVPTSILFIKYYPDLGRGYGRWDGKLYNVGVTTNKNSLGMMCLVVGLSALWQFLLTLKSKKSPRRLKKLIAQGMLAGMVIWLLTIADSATSIACFGLAGTLIVATSFSWFARRPRMVHCMTFSLLAIAVSALFLNVGSGALESLGRDSTLTGRTEIWRRLFGLVDNPLFGSGFESFWLSDKIDTTFTFFYRLNEAHNGYIEVFLNGGWVGITLLAILLATGYRNIAKAFRGERDFARLRMAYLLAGLIYCTTEAGFRMMSPVWILILLSIANVPGPRSCKVAARTPESQDATVIHEEERSEVEPEIALSTFRFTSVTGLR
ncbi:MAG: O-antigen ligase family protein [Acidobacteria bacterium]|nr:O-antigen ligase family protein [Acidobacteriota bacterium]